MKIFRSLIAVLFLVAAVPTPAQADTLITLSKPSFRLADGRFLNNDLASLLATDAELDTVLAKPIRGSRTWLIDPALFEEIADLGDGYVYIDAEGNDVTVDEFPAAEQWLSLFTFVTRNDRIVAMTYGNPSVSYLRKYAPGELATYNKLSQTRLAEILGREVSAPSSIAGTGNPSAAAQNSYSTLRKSIRVINSLVTTRDVEDLRLGLAKTLNPGFSKANALAMVRSYQNEVSEFQKRLRVSPGNYTITAAKYDLPVTIINDFDQLVSIDLDITTTNSRVLVSQVPRITLQPRSQVQINLPIQVIASGETALRLQIRTPQGSAIGESTRIPLRLAVISPVTTWFTTGMAIILLLAAIVQSVRRVKRRKSNE